MLHGTYYHNSVPPATPSRRQSSVASINSIGSASPATSESIWRSAPGSTPTQLQPRWDIWAPAPSSMGQQVSPVSSPWAMTGASSSPTMAASATSTQMAPASPPRAWVSPFPASLGPSPSWSLAPHPAGKVAQTPSQQREQIRQPQPVSPPLSPQHSPAEQLQKLEIVEANENLIADTTGPLYLVQFKGQRTDVFTSAAPAYQEGQLVIVDADRGKDVGTIVAANVSPSRAAALKISQHAERQHVLYQCGATCKESPPQQHLGVCVPKQILRAAQPAEVRLAEKRSDEAKAVALCNRKAREHGLDMTIVDAEYQWDRRKLTFFYRAGHRVDFRELVRELFRNYKTRIWMCVVPTEGTDAE